MITCMDMEHFGYSEKKTICEMVATAIRKTKEEHNIIRRMMDNLKGEPSPFIILPVMRLWTIHERDEIRFLKDEAFKNPPLKIIKTGEKIQEICEDFACGALGDAIMIKGVQERLLDDINDHMKYEEEWFKDVYAQAIFH